MKKKSQPKRVSPWSDLQDHSTPDRTPETAGVDTSISPKGRAMIEVLVGPANGPKIRAWCRPEERICLPKKLAK